MVVMMNKRPTLAMLNEKAHLGDDAEQKPYLGDDAELKAYLDGDAKRKGPP
jgi:hypothetical protein